MKQPDAIIIGGGIQGASLALAIAQRGLNPLLIERNELANGASGNSYGIVHGGLRYLQSVDIQRWRRARKAQAWFLNHFPAYVKPLRCIMPLYQWRLRSPFLFRCAIYMEKFLMRAFSIASPLPAPFLLSAEAVSKDYPLIPPKKLTGAACWYDAEVTDMPGLVDAMLQRAGLTPSSVLTQTEAQTLLVQNGHVTGLRVIDKSSGSIRDLHSNIVINCTGAWSGSWKHGTAVPSTACLAFNLLFEQPMSGNSALALSAVPGKGRSYFIRPYAGGLLAGTYYRPATGIAGGQVTERDIRNFRAELDSAYPGMGLLKANILKVMPGLLPDKDGRGRQLSSKDHVLSNGTKGFYTVLGGKFTTAPLLSEDAVTEIWPGVDKTPSQPLDATSAGMSKQHV